MLKIQPASMQPFSTLLLRHELLLLPGSQASAGSRSLLSSSLPGGSRLLDRPFDFPRCTLHSGSPEWEEQSGAWPSSSEAEDMHKVSPYFDPLEGKIKSTPVVDENESFRVGKPFTKKKGHNVGPYAVVKRKSGKGRISWVCDNCGEGFGQWWGSCPSCHTLASVKKFVEAEVSTSRGSEISEAVVRSWFPQQLRTAAPLSLAEVSASRNQSEWRIPLSGHFGQEVSRVLGGGIVPGSLILIGGDPGIGKSTLLLQIASILAQGFNHNGPAPVVYVSGEESIEQIGNRADRMSITTKELFLYSSTDIEDILDKIQTLFPRALVVDSIQTVYLKGVTGSAGNIMQVKECTSALLRFAKQTNIPILFTGHVTKSGDIAGPRMLEHIVDGVFYMEGERYSSYRLLRSVKNRFGSTDELGVFEMTEFGLQAVSNPSEIFLSEHFSDSEVLAGLAVAVILDGSRTFLVEIQVLMKQVGLKLQENDF
ncbi:DNA repair protein RadA-like isoform X5 [Zingiber officinale]|uniref:DNA repair protein RadA-like isoform X5 n=1 Tax=Zingiber officinale TaxID=94328 RepID=UPI001C4CAF4B|nr:DNA repair protein RadA-like isoform X5 [Zingiber officinale]